MHGMGSAVCRKAWREIHRIGNPLLKTKLDPSHDGNLAGNGTYHDFVLKDGLVWDQWYKAMSLQTFLAKFPGWTAADLVRIYPR